MKNRKYIPQTTNKVISAMYCFWCIHRNKCVNAYLVKSKFCLSFQKKAGIKKRIKKQRGNNGK